MNIFNEQIEASKRFIPAIGQALHETYFSNYDSEILRSELGKCDIENNVFKRYEHSLQHVLPWLSRRVKLEGKKVLEIGCGTGSSTAALAHYVQTIDGYDINTLAVQGARRRLDIMGLTNACLHIVTTDALIPQIRENANNKYDIILLFAVLEHQTVVERHNTLKTCWDLLAEGGVMAVVDTPNILHYYDIHTSRLPFMHMLPTRIYARYAKNSSRPSFKKSFENEHHQTDAELDNEIARWGRGVSYHDFELTLGEDYSKFLIAEGFEPEILQWFPCTTEEELLRWYVEHKNFSIPSGFTRCVLNLIFQKPSSNVHTEQSNAFSPPPFTILNPSIERKNDELTALIDKLYRSKTWRMGNIFAIPYRKVQRLLKK